MVWIVDSVRYPHAHQIIIQLLGVANCKQEGLKLRILSIFEDNPEAHTYKEQEQ